MKPRDLSTRPELSPYIARGYWPCDCPGYRLNRPEAAACPTCGKEHTPAPAAGVKPAATDTPLKIASQGPAKAKTKTEIEAERRFCPPGARFEAITFALANGHRYTPDFTWWDGFNLVCLEVKGSYKLGSYQRARMAFDQARVEWPEITWRWVERQKDGTWKE